VQTPALAPSISWPENGRKIKRLIFAGRHAGTRRATLSEGNGAMKHGQCKFGNATDHEKIRSWSGIGSMR